MNTEEILAKYLSEHDALGAQKDAPDKEAFDEAHREVWRLCDEALRERLEELEDKDHLSPEEEQELVELLARLG